MAERGRKILLVPAGGAGDGMGHLARCIRLAGQLGRGVTLLAARLDPGSRKQLLRTSLGTRGKTRLEVITSVTPGRRWDLIVLDGRTTSKPDLSVLESRGPVVCLDEGGDAREAASFLIDCLPGLPGRSPANLSSPEFLDLPTRSRKKRAGSPRNILVSFGGEDRENLSGRLLGALLGPLGFAPSRITIVEGPLFGKRQWPLGVKVLRGVNRLADLLGEYDLVFTHFGMTCFESLASGVPVVLLNPSAYHARLARTAGIPDIGITTPDTTRLKRLLADPAGLARPVDQLNAALGAKRTGRLASLLRSLSVHGTPRCPVCGRGANPVMARFPERTYRKCGGCGVMYLESFSSRATTYDAAYFGEEYKAHYGRTYLDDFESIKAASRERLRIMRGLAGAKVDGAVVDVGCAYGPFLDAAKDEGLPCFGIDVSAAAIDYVRRKLGIPSLRVSFEDVQRRRLPRRIAAITLWWVIEHFSDVDFVLRKAASFLPAGGVLAFSTPNARGISGRGNLGLFLEKSPGDHVTIFSPRGLARLLSSYGLELRRVRVTGHHPERFPGALGKAARASAAAARILTFTSKALGLGDTFEAYAVKGEQA